MPLSDPVQAPERERERERERESESERKRERKRVYREVAEGDGSLLLDLVVLV